MEWGMTGYEDEEQDRPQFLGEEIPSPINGQVVLWFSPRAKLVRVLTSFLVVTFSLLVVMGAVSGIFIFRYVGRDGHVLSSYFSYDGTNYSGAAASVLNAVQIQVMNALYGSIAIQLNNYENHRTDTEYEDHLIAKTFLFQFVNSYASCFYIAFLKNLIPGEECALENGTPNCMGELNITLGIIFILRITSGNFMEIVLPWLKRKHLKFTSKNGSSQKSTNRVVSAAEEEMYMDVYDSMGTFEVTKFKFFFSPIVLKI